MNGKTFQILSTLFPFYFKTIKSNQNKQTETHLCFLPSPSYSSKNEESPISYSISCMPKSTAYFYF